jgi:hypothetical protein
MNAESENVIAVSGWRKLAASKVQRSEHPCKWILMCSQQLVNRPAERAVIRHDRAAINLVLLGQRRESEQISEEHHLFACSRIVVHSSYLTRAR